MDRAPEAIVVMDIERRKIVDTNPMAEKLFGCSREKLLQAGLERFYSPHQSDEVSVIESIDENIDENIRRALAGEELIFERNIKSDDGRDLVCEVRLTRLSFGESQLVRGSFIDITERKELEAEREQYFKFFNSSIDLLCIADLSGHFKKINPAFMQTLGYSEAELLSKPYIDFVHPDDLQPTLDVMKAQNRRGFTLDFENRYRCKDGSFRWLLWHTRINKDEGANYAVAHDITEQKQIQEALKASEGKYRALVETTDTGYLILNMEGKVVDANAEYVRLYIAT